MMHIAVNVLPLKTGHKVRGIGFYTKNLVDNLKKDKSLTIEEFENISQLKDVDVLHYPWFDLFFHTLSIKKKFPTVVTIHDVIPLLFPDHYPIGFRARINFHLQRIALNGCKFIITDSKVSKEDIIKYLKVNEEKIVVIKLAADSKFRVLNDTKLIHAKRAYQLPDQFLLYVGDANWFKNLPFLIKGFKSLIQKPNFVKVKLVFVGGVFLKNVENIAHPELESLKKVNSMIKEYGLEDHIVRPGNVDTEDLVAIYNLASLYIQPSFYEGFGLPILESLSCGTPVLSSNRGSLPEVGGNAAIYFDPTNIQQFVSILSETLQDKSLRNKLSKMGLEQSKRFSWDKVAQETKQVYIKAANKESK